MGSTRTLGAASSQAQLTIKKKKGVLFEIMWPDTDSFFANYSNLCTTSFVFGRGRLLHQHFSHQSFFRFMLPFSDGPFSEFVATVDLLHLVAWRGCLPLVQKPRLRDLPQLMNFLRMA